MSGDSVSCGAGGRRRERHELVILFLSRIGAAATTAMALMATWMIMLPEPGSRYANKCGTTASFPTAA
jgi:hypothetical protein